MKNGRNILGALALLSLAAMLPAANKSILENEDLAFIATWERNRNITQIAASLKLTSAQIADLTEIKTETDRINADFEARKTALLEELHQNAANIRTRLESENMLSDQDRVSLKTSRKNLRALRKERALRLSLAMMGLEGLLTDQQEQIMARMLRQKAEPGLRAGKGGDRAARRPVRKMRIGARVLLSESFLNYYASPGK